MSLPGSLFIDGTWQDALKMVASWAATDAAPAAGDATTAAVDRTRPPRASAQPDAGPSTRSATPDGRPASASRTSRWARDLVDTGAGATARLIPMTLVEIVRIALVARRHVDLLRCASALCTA